MNNSYISYFFRNFKYFVYMFFCKKFQNIWKMFLNGTEGCNNLYWLVVNWMVVSFKKGFRYKTSRKTPIPRPNCDLDLSQKPFRAAKRVARTQRRSKPVVRVPPGVPLGVWGNMGF